MKTLSLFFIRLSLPTISIMQNMTKIKTVLVLIALSILIYSPLSAQTSMLGQNVLTTSVPFLLISPDARGGAMGEVGVTSAPDANSMHYNPAKYAYIEKDFGTSICYSPWLKNLNADINLFYLAGYKRINKKQVVAASLRYFNIGDINFTDNQGYSLGNYKPYELALDAAYSRFFTPTLSGSVAARYIHSNLTLGQTIENNQATHPGNSIAADVSLYQQIPVEFKTTEGYFAWGLNISNMGAKISYSDDNLQKDFLPTNLRFGPSLTLDVDDYNRVSFMIDINKLLVPTPPLVDENDSIIAGMDPDVSLPVGMLHSFYDAPGGFGEEMREFTIGTGIEYWYNKQFAVRGGYFYEDANKGDRKYLNFGLGLRYNVFGLDFSYLVPMATQHPLGNTLRFSLLVNFEPAK